MDLVKALSKSNFQHMNLLIHLFTGGSHQHGARLENTGDLDLCGVYLEPPVSILGVDGEAGYVSGTSDQYTRNKPGDEDYTLKTLREWARLACKGNPTILGFIFAPREISDPSLFNSVWYTHIVPNRDVFAASSHAVAFLGYGRGQLHRMQGLKGQGKHGQREELELIHGYDTKAAMHLIRMMYEGLEFVTTGQLTYPRPEVDVLLSIRKGEWTQNQVEQEYLRLEERLKDAQSKSPLPPAVDRKRVSEIIAAAYIHQWKKNDLL